MRRLTIAIALVLAAAAAARAQPPAPVTYTVTFPEPEHHWLQVDVRFPDVGYAPLDVRMSRSSPGRYAVHEFAKNIFSLQAFDGQGRAIQPSRPDADTWRVAGHDGTVRIVYRVFGDQADGTYLAVDTTHAHMNMPATFLWAAGLEDRAIRITFAPPAASRWTAGTQLFPTTDPLAFTAPNLQYFMDSPTELAPWVTSTFEVPNADGTPARFRVMTHGDGAQADVDALAALIARVVREEGAIFGEYPRYETGRYTFLLDLVPWVDSDAMEHRNSTAISVPGVSLRTAEGRAATLDSVAHEFFHNWNVERIRPAGIEPFDFTRENVTCCLWLAEGFTQYYGDLVLRRAGLTDVAPVGYAAAVITGPGRQVRSAVGMSEQAPFADAGIANDVIDRGRTYVSYYSYGAGIALGLDLTLRERSAGRQSLDEYMRRLWTEFGAPAAPRPGYVARPYTLADLRRVLADLTGDTGFADTFFDRYVEGHEVVDYAALLATVGVTLRADRATRGWTGGVQVVDDHGSLLVGASPFGEGEYLVAFGTPAYAAGLDAGDRVLLIDGQPATAARWAALASRRPGDRVALVVARRDGQRVTTTLTLAADPNLETTDAGTLTAAQRARRDAWLGTRVR
jgi:predicted metalloprotease with PDZ domain